EITNAPKEMVVGQKMKLNIATFFGGIQGKLPKELNYISSNSNVIKIENNEITAINNGIATISVVYYGLNDSATIKVIGPKKEENVEKKASKATSKIVEDASINNTPKKVHEKNPTENINKNNKKEPVKEVVKSTSQPSLNNSEVKEKKTTQNNSTPLKNSYNIGESIFIKKDTLEKNNNEITLKYTLKENEKVNENKLTIYNENSNGSLCEMEKVKLNLENKSLTFTTNKEGNYRIKEKEEEILKDNNIEENKSNDTNKKEETSNNTELIKPQDNIIVQTISNPILKYFSIGICFILAILGVIKVRKTIKK
ncbi:MAG: hypothetical protein ACRC7R_02455, partial [Sarcina sp.]